MMFADRITPVKDFAVTYWTVCALFFLSLIFFLLFMIDTPVNGDTYAYARSISTFEGPIIHIGYYSIGYIFHSLLKQFGSTPLQTLGYMSCFFGSISVICMYLFTFMLTENRLQSFLAALILMFSGTLWFFSIHGEVYVPQLAFVLISVLFIMKKRALLSSLSILVAISITPTSCLAIPPIIYLMYVKQFEKKQIIYFAFPILLALIFLIAWDISKLLNILAKAIHSPKVFFESFSYKALILKVPYSLIKVYGKSFNLISFVGIFGFAILYKEDKKIWWSMLAFILPFSLYLLNLDLFSGDHLIISFIAISFFGSYGIIHLFKITNASLQIKRLAVILILFGHLWVSYQLFIRPEIRDAQELKKVVNNLADEYNTNALMISDYNFGMAFWYLTNEETDFFLFTGRPNEVLREHGGNFRECQKKLDAKFWINLSQLPDFIYQLGLKRSSGFIYRLGLKQSSGQRLLYFVDRSDWPTWIVRLLLSDKSLEKRKREITKLKRCKTYLEERSEEKFEFLKFIDSPLWPVYVWPRT